MPNYSFRGYRVIWKYIQYRNLIIVFFFFTVIKLLVQMHFSRAVNPKIEGIKRLREVGIVDGI